MEILTFAAGLVLGVIPVAVDLGASVPVAELLLDGEPVCVVTAAEPGCRVDLGPELTVHRLDLVRRDLAGKPVETVSRFVNRPGCDAPEVRVRREGASEGRTEVSFGWAHPDRLDPVTWRVTLDGEVVLTKPLRDATLCVDEKQHVVAVDAAFEDGRKASTVALLGGSRGTEIEDRLSGAVVEYTATEADKRPPLEPAALSRLLGGRPIREIETGPSELVIVLDPVAAEDLADARRMQDYPSVGDARLKKVLEEPTRFWVVHPETGSGRFARAEPATASERLDVLVEGVTDEDGLRLKVADAVASAGFLAAASQHRRGVVLVLGAARPDHSALAPRQVQAFLKELMVPLWVVVTGKGTRPAAGWGAGTPVKTLAELRKALRAVDDALDRQRVVWLEGDPLPSSIQLEDPSGAFHLAGR